MTLRATGVGLALAIVVADLVQIPLLGKGWGPLGGAAVYGLVAFGLARDVRVAWGVALAMPVVPTAVLSGLLGPAIRARFVDGAMWAVYAVQLVLALVALTALFSPVVRSDGDLS